MADAKIEIKVGAVSFSGEGDSRWLSEQLDKMLEKIPTLVKVAPSAPDGADGTKHPSPQRTTIRTTLASFLRDKAALTQQVRKFLATAVWLHDQNSKLRLSTKDVGNALSASNQRRLNNAADCLNQNVKKGYCEKDGKEFFVTDDGRTELG